MSILILTNSHEQHSTPCPEPNSNLVLINPSTANNSNDYLIKPNSNEVLKVCTPNKYILQKKPKYLETDNYFSEYDTKEEKAVARKNLGILGHAIWGNVEGYVEDLSDLVDFIDGKINDLTTEGLTPALKKLETEQELLLNLLNELSDIITLVLTEVNENLHKKVTIENEEETEASKQILYLVKNSDLKLNLDFSNALKVVLGGSDINSIDDAISILLYKMFPITYTDWSISVTNTATKSYSIEKGTTQTITPSAELGTITILLNRGNKGDTPVSLTVNGTDILETDKTTYSINVKFSDVTNQTNINSSKEKSYEIVLTTTSKTIQRTVKASINITNVLYYFFDSDVTPITSITSSALKQTSNEYLFTLGDSLEYLTVFSPKDVSKVETKAGFSESDLDTYRVITGYSKNTVTYTPTNGTPLTYTRITLDDPQSNCVKIRVT